jgi:hypothetical protein
MSAFNTAGGTTSASSASMPATLISSAPPRLCASQGTLWYFNPTREGRPPRRPSQCQHPYPAQRHRASARAKALYGISICRGRDDLRVVRKPSLRQKTWKIGLLILRPNRPIRSQFTAGTPSPVSALGPASSRSPRFCVKILHNLTVLFHSNQSLRNLRLNSSALPTS